MGARIKHQGAYTMRVAAGRATLAMYSAGSIKSIRPLRRHVLAARRVPPGGTGHGCRLPEDGLDVCLEHGFALHKLDDPGGDVHAVLEEL